jgi:hypothetical protein
LPNNLKIRGSVRTNIIFWASDFSSFEHYLTCQALGLAILLALENPDERAERLLPEDPPEVRAFRRKGPTRSVVLIDEIDKAPGTCPRTSQMKWNLCSLRCGKPPGPPSRPRRPSRCLSSF